MGNKRGAPGVASWMNTTIAPPRGRRLASLAAFGAAATTMWGYGAYESLAHKPVAWGAFAVAALVGGAAYGVGRASALSQVLSRGVAWAALVPAVLVLGAEAREHGGRLDPWALAFAAALAIGLVVARPLLHTERARRDFHPIAVRRPLLAGSIASVATAAWLACASYVLFDMHPTGGSELAVAATALAASAVGVVRMRGWGVLLGALTSTALLGAALLTRDYARAALALSAVPGAAIAASVLFARLRPAPAALAPIRVAELAPVRARIAVDDDFENEVSMAANARRSSRHPVGATIA